MKIGDLMIYLPVLFMILFACLIGGLIIKDMMVTKECNTLSGCEVHKCFQDNSVTIFQQTSASLKYQNCLLEEREDNAQLKN